MNVRACVRSTYVHADRPGHVFGEVTALGRNVLQRVEMHEFCVCTHMHTALSPELPFCQNKDKRCMHPSRPLFFPARTCCDDD